MKPQKDIKTTVHNQFANALKEHRLATFILTLIGKPPLDYFIKIFESRCENWYLTNTIQRQYKRPAQIDLENAQNDLAHYYPEYKFERVV